MSDARAPQPAVDWTAIERSPELRELVEGRRRFTWAAGAAGIGLGVLYVVVSALAPDVMGTQVVGAISLGYLGGVGLIVMTWLITLAYMRRSDRVWGTLEERVGQMAGVAAAEAGRPPRFTAAEPERARGEVPR